jgi:hypothetical protein
MADPVWIQPSGGTLTNGSRPWRRGDVALIQLILDTSNLETLTLMAGRLPPGIQYDPLTRSMKGVIEALPKGDLDYTVIFRATLASGRFYDRSFKWAVDPLDEHQYWQSPSGVKDLGIIDRGSNVSIQLNLINLDLDHIEYRVVGERGPSGSHAGLPLGLVVDNFGRITGSPSITNNPPGDYYFRVFARDPQDLAHHPRLEGSPRTSETLYRLSLSSTINLDARLSDVVRWVSPEGSLGSTWETYPSHFQIVAQPQYRINQVDALETQSIYYTLADDSDPLPEGLFLERETGLIAGRCPYVNASRTYELTVEARVVFINHNGGIRLSTISSKRDFTLTIRSLLTNDSLTNINISLPSMFRSKALSWLWTDRPNASGVSENQKILSSDRLYRPTDQFFGRKSQFKILLIGSINYRGNLQQKLNTYHHSTTLRVGQLRSAIARDPDGSHIYDVLYLTIQDSQLGAGGFNSQGQEQSLNRYVEGQPLTSIPSWNLTANDAHYYPASIKNFRQDFIQRQGRLAGHEGYGLDGREALSQWMMSEQISGVPSSIPGYQCVIELAYVRPGLGPSVVKGLQRAGMEQDLQGITIDVAGFLLERNTVNSTIFDRLNPTEEITVFDGPDITEEDTIFDGPNDTVQVITFDGPDVLAITTFDGPDALVDPTFQYTRFDLELQVENKYYKFSSGDV